MLKPPNEETNSRPLYYGVHNNGLDYAHGSYLRNGLDSLVKQRGFLLSYVDKIPNVEGKDDYVTAHEMTLPTLTWCEYQCSLFQAPR